MMMMTSFTHSRVRGHVGGGSVVHANASKQDEHKSEGDTSSVVRRSPRYSARRGTAAATGKTADD